MRAAASRQYLKCKKEKHSISSFSNLETFKFSNSVTLLLVRKIAQFNVGNVIGNGVGNNTV